MKIVEAMLLAHPESNSTDRRVAALEALARCEQICLSCADACLAEYSWENLRPCIRINLDCAAICSVTVQLVVRQIEATSAMVQAQLHACAIACATCAELCAAHGFRHSHCEICAKACRDCQGKVQVLLGEVSGFGVLSSN